MDGIKVDDSQTTLGLVIRVLSGSQERH